MPKCGGGGGVHGKKAKVKMMPLTDRLTAQVPRGLPSFLHFTLLFLSQSVGRHHEIRPAAAATGQKGRGGRRLR